MDPVRNPYTPGAGSKPPALEGRDAEIRSFEVLLARMLRGRTEKSLFVTGLRGVGKTVLLGRFRDMAEAGGFHTADTEITHETEFRSTIARLTRRVVLALDPRRRAKEHVRRATAVFKAFTLKLPDGYEIGVDVEALRGSGDSGRLDEDLADLFVALGEAAKERSTGVVFLLDEVHFLGRRDLEALIAAVHRVSQRALPLAVVGAGLPQLPRLAGEAKSYAERLFDFPVIDKLPLPAAREALEKPAKEQGVTFEAEATDIILDYTEGYPYFLQEYGKHVWNLAPGPTITSFDSKRARIEVQNQLDENFFRVRVSRATNVERQYLAAMAALGKGPYRSGLIAEKLRRASTSVAPVRNILINKGLVYSPSHGIIDFTVPHFDDYLRRTYPSRQD